MNNTRVFYLDRSGELRKEGEIVSRIRRLTLGREFDIPAPAFRCIGVGNYINPESAESVLERTLAEHNVDFVLLISDQLSPEIFLQLNVSLVGKGYGVSFDDSFLVVFRVKEVAVT